MIAREFKIIFALFCWTLSCLGLSYAKSDTEEAKIKVAMRTIGHELLLQSGDSVSRVLAVEKEKARYKIEFSAKLQFDPAYLVNTVEEVIQKSKIANRYIVEVESCGTGKVAYSYQIDDHPASDLIPCMGRELPPDCYQVFFTILDVAASPAEPNKNGLLSTGSISLLMGALVLLGLVFYGRKKNPQINLDPNKIWIGDYSYDKKTMILSHKGTETELSSKEADLLLLLYSEENKVLERENILKVVWGDKGDYVGRTLDVFISKLRKKLAADPNLKIVNIRGIGYKFVLAAKK